MAKQAVKTKQTVDLRAEFDERLAPYYDELKWLYMELYNDMGHLNDLVATSFQFFKERNEELKAMDAERMQDADWYKRSTMMGMMMYVNNFAGNLEGLKEHIDYLSELHVNYLHLMPLLSMPETENDGGYAVSDYRNVDKRIGTIEQLSEVAGICHKRGISICLDFILNHTSDEHEWAVRAKNGEQEYIDRYICYDTYDIPSQYERTVPQVFPKTAPGNFTWIECMKKHVMTSFYTYQWDLNYRNPVVFNEMTYNLLYLANKGVDIFRIDAVPYIWKELGTSCRNRPQVHTIMRMMHIIAQVVCPGVVFKGEVVMKPEEVAPYFGPVDKPECDMLYNVTTMVCIWNSLATKDTRVLRKQMEAMNALPTQYAFINYVRCHDDLGWGLDEDYVRFLGFDPLEHKKFLYNFYSGKFPGSYARGELYNYDPVTQDARSCGTTASFCGIEEAVYRGDQFAIDQSIQRDLMLHAYILSLSGIPVIYSGDEIAQCNDYNYHNDPAHAMDSRFIHRGKFDWTKAEQRKDASTVEGKVFQGLQKLVDIRRENDIFDGIARVYNINLEDTTLLAFAREAYFKKVVCVYNFCEFTKYVNLWEDGMYTDLISGRRVRANDFMIEPYGYLWLMRD